MITDRETDLRNDAAKGLDGSPGNGVSAWAVREIDRLRADLEDYRKASEERGVEIARAKDENDTLKRAFTPNGSLARENEALRTENAQLRAALGDGASETIGTLQREVDRVRAEKARLRKVLTAFVDTCDHSPPMLFVVNLGKCCEQARVVLKENHL